jgi:hypothetical protein
MLPATAAAKELVAGVLSAIRMANKSRDDGHAHVRFASHLENFGSTKF